MTLNFFVERRLSELNVSFYYYDKLKQLLPKYWRYCKFNGRRGENIFSV
jgi:hypothetical protein